MAANIMGQSIPQLRRWQRGQPLDHRQLNEPVEAINRMMTGVGPPKQTMARVGGGAAATASEPVLLALDAGLGDDFLVCRAIDSNPLNYTPIVVAKPWLLRKTPFASAGPADTAGPVRGEVRYVYDAANSTKRTAYDINDPPGTPEAERNKRTEMISPQYIPDQLGTETVTQGDELLIASASTGVVAKTLEPDPDNPEGPPISVLTPVLLIDITGIRGWTVIYEQL